MEADGHANCVLARLHRTEPSEHARTHARCERQGACTQNTRELLLPACWRVARDSRAARGRENRGGLTVATGEGVGGLPTSLSLITRVI